MTTTIATKRTRKPKQAEAEVTLDQVVEQRLREMLESYREYVEKAATGEQVYGDDLARVESLLGDMELPVYAWARDVEALKKQRHLTIQLEEAEARRPAEVKEAEQLAADIPHIERRLAEARGRLNELTAVRTNTIVGLHQRLQELRMNHPHVLGSVEKAIELKMAKRKQRADSLERSGWLS